MGRVPIIGIVGIMILMNKEQFRVKFIYFLSCRESILKEKKLLVKIKLKNQLQESSMEYLIEQTLM